MMTNRRHILTGLAATALWPRMARAATPIGAATGVSGQAMLSHVGVEGALAVGGAVFDGDRVRTGAGSLVQLLLNTETRLHLGPESDLILERYLADIGGTISLGGALVFDRPESLPKLDLTLSTAFGAIGVRGTRFFAGPSNGSYAVFVQRGAVTVSAAGVTRDLGPGDGVNLGADAPPSEVVRWGAARIEAAFASVGTTP